MKTMLKVALLSLSIGILTNTPSYSISLGERFGALVDSFKYGPKIAIGESTSLVYAYAIPMRGGDAGSNRAGSILPIFNWSVLSADAGLLSGDLEAPSKVTGSPLVGGSIHIDEVLAIMFPEVSTALHGFIPGTADKLVYEIQIGVGLSHDFVVERTLPVVYVGPNLKF